MHRRMRAKATGARDTKRGDNTQSDVEEPGEHDEGQRGIAMKTTGPDGVTMVTLMMIVMAAIDITTQQNLRPVHFREEGRLLTSKSSAFVRIFVNITFWTKSCSEAEDILDEEKTGIWHRLASETKGRRRVERWDKIRNIQLTRLRRICNRLDLLPSHAHKRRHVGRKSSDHGRRRKRNTMLMAAGAGSLFGAFALSKISTLAEKREDLNHLLLTAREHETRLKQLETDSSRLKDILNETISHLMRTDEAIEELYETRFIEAQLDHFIESIAIISRTVEMMYQGSLSSEILSINQVNTIMTRLLTEVSKANYRIPFNSYANILEVKTDYVIIEGGFILILLVPIVPAQQKELKLLEYIPIPWETNLTTTYMVVTSPNQKQYLAVTDSRSQSIELTEAEVASCERIGHIRLCTNSKINMKTEDTCLGSLFTSNTEGVANLCHTNYITEASRMVQVSDREIMIASPHLMSVDVSCPALEWGGQAIEERHAIKGIRTINTAPGCYIVTRKESITTRMTTIGMNYSSTSYKIDFSELDMDVSAGDLDGALEALARIGTMRPGLSAVRVYARTRTYSTMEIGVIIAIAVTGIITLISVSMYMYIHFARTKIERLISDMNKLQVLDSETNIQAIPMLTPLQTFRGQSESMVDMRR